MKKTSILLLIWGAIIGGRFGSAVDTPSGRNLVENPGFEAPGSGSAPAAGWQTAAPRPEVAPEFAIDSTVAHSGRSSARTSAKGSPGTLGTWTTAVEGIRGESADDFGMTQLTVRDQDFLKAELVRGQALPDS